MTIILTPGDQIIEIGDLLAGVQMSSPGGGTAAWSPLDLVTLEAWYDFDNDSSVFESTDNTDPVEDGDNIQYMEDLSGNGYHLGLGTHPTWDEDAQNGKSIGDFAAGDQLLGSASGLSLSGLTLAIAVNVIGTGGHKGIFSLPFGTSNDYQSDDSFLWLTSGVWRGGPNVSFSYTTSTWHVFLFRLATNSLSIYVDGGTAAATGTIGDTSAIDPSTIRINGRGEGGPGLANKHGEAVLCNGDIGVADCNSLCNYLAAKWGTTWTAIS